MAEAQLIAEKTRVLLAFADSRQVELQGRCGALQSDSCQLVVEAVDQMPLRPNQIEFSRRVVACLSRVGQIFRHHVGSISRGRQPGQKRPIFLLRAPVFPIATGCFEDAAA